MRRNFIILRRAQRSNPRAHLVVHRDAAVNKIVIAKAAQPSGAHAMREPRQAVADRDLVVAALGRRQHVGEDGAVRRAVAEGGHGVKRGAVRRRMQEADQEI